MYDAEKQTPIDERTIERVGDAFWWAMVTVTTVGYGDVYPRSASGRLLAVLLMITGIALIGTITAAVAAWFVNIVRSASSSETEVEASNERAELLAELQALSTKVDELQAEFRLAVTPEDVLGALEPLDVLEQATTTPRREAPGGTRGDLSTS